MVNGQKTEESNEWVAPPVLFRRMTLFQIFVNLTIVAIMRASSFQKSREHAGVTIKKYPHTASPHLQRRLLFVDLLCSFLGASCTCARPNRTGWSVNREFVQSHFSHCCEEDVIQQRGQDVRPRQTWNLRDTSSSSDCTRVHIPLWNMRTILIFRGGSPRTWKYFLQEHAGYVVTHNYAS